MAALVPDGENRRLLVKNIPPKANINDKLTIYFQKKKHGGCGDVIGVTFPNILETDRAVVEFEDAATVQSVLRHQPHDFFHTRLNVLEFQQQCFGKADVILSEATTDQLRAATDLVKLIREKTGVSFLQKDSKNHMTGQWYQVTAAVGMIEEFVQRSQSVTAMNQPSASVSPTSVNSMPGEVQQRVGNDGRAQADDEVGKAEIPSAKKNREEVALDGNVFAFLNICHSDICRTMMKNFKVNVVKAESGFIITSRNKGDSTGPKEAAVKLQAWCGKFLSGVKKLESDGPNFPGATDGVIKRAAADTNKIHKAVFVGHAKPQDRNSKIVCLALTEVDARRALDTFWSMFPPDKNEHVTRFRLSNSSCKISVVHGDFRRACTDAMLSEVDVNTRYGNVLAYCDDYMRQLVLKALRSSVCSETNSDGKFECSRIFHCKQAQRGISTDCFARVSAQGLKSMTVPIFWPNHYPNKEMTQDDYRDICLSIISHALTQGVKALKELHILFSNLLQALKFIDVLKSLDGFAEDFDDSSESGSSSSRKNSVKYEEDKVESCAICLEDLDGAVSMKTLPCKHTFHQACIDKAFSVSKKCPMCMRFYGKPEGIQPKSGTMSTRVERQRLPGYYCDTIVISYQFPSGTQGPEHPNPGHRFHGTSRQAYLPNNEEGRRVLLLLRKAFDARLTFTVGRSVTTGAQNCVTWNDIHHKTSTHGGPAAFGYPDPGYLTRLRMELADKGITPDSN